MRGQMILNLGLKGWTMFLATAFMLGSCVEDDILENNHNLTKGETISFDAVVEWPKDHIEGRSAMAASDRVSQTVLHSEDSCNTLSMGVYVQDGFYPLDEEKVNSRGAVLTELSSFNVWATLNKAQNVGGGSISYISDVAYYKVGNENLYSSTGAVYYWPGEGPTLDFVAVGGKPNYDGVTFTPNFANNKLTSFTYTVPADATKQNDIVVATASGVVGNNDKSVPLDFGHIMSAVNVKIGSNITEGTIHSITFSNIKSTGTYNITGGNWGEESAKTNPTSYTLTFTDGYSTSGKTEGTVINGTTATLMMLPQALTSSSEIIVNFTHAATNNNVNLKASLKDQSWQMGKTTNYYININPDFTLSIEEESVPTADCHYDTRVITIKNEHSTVDWTLSSNVDWVKFRILSDDYDTNTNYTAYKDYWVEDHVVTTITRYVDTTIEDTNKQEISRTEKTTNHSIVNNLAGTGSAKIILYCYENTESNTERTARTAKIYLKDSNGNIKDELFLNQYYPLWGSGNIAYERIEENNTTYPWGFASSRIVNYSYPNIADVDWGDWQGLWDLIVSAKSWPLVGGLAKRIYNAVIGDKLEARSDAYTTFKSTYADTSVTGFITLTGNGDSDWSVKLDYGKLNSISATGTGFNNTKRIITYGGGTTGSDAETWLNSNNMVKGTETNTNDNTTIPMTAAYQAVKKNSWMLTTTIINTTRKVQNPSTKETFEVEETEMISSIELATDDIEWFLPSKDEIATLKPTACDNDNINNDEALSGSYWTSTSGTGVTAFYYNAADETVTEVSRVATTKHKIRAARMKP